MRPLCWRFEPRQLTKIQLGTGVAQDGRPRTIWYCLSYAMFVLQNNVSWTMALTLLKVSCDVLVSTGVNFVILRHIWNALSPTDVMRPTVSVFCGCGVSPRFWHLFSAACLCFLAFLFKKIFLSVGLLCCASCFYFYYRLLCVGFKRQLRGEISDFGIWHR